MFQPFKSMRQRLNMSPVSSSVPVGSSSQDDILTRDHQPHVPQGKFTSSANKDIHTHTAVCTCALRAHLNGLDVMQIVHSPCVRIICRVMVLMTPKPLVGRSFCSEQLSLRSSSQMERDRTRADSTCIRNFTPFMNFYP